VFVTVKLGRSTGYPAFVMSPPLIGGGIKRWCCLTSDVSLDVGRVHRAWVENREA